MGHDEVLNKYNLSEALKQYSEIASTVSVYEPYENIEEFQKLKDLGLRVNITKDDRGISIFTTPIGNNLIVNDTNTDPLTLKGNVAAREIFLGISILLYDNTSLTRFNNGATVRIDKDLSTFEGWKDAIQKAYIEWVKFVDGIETRGCVYLKTPEMRHEKRGLVMSTKYGF